MRTGRWLVPGLCALFISCVTGRMQGTRPAEGEVAADVALQVPYVSQSELLCGGAAIAMIERWWGRRGVYAEDFAYLVQRASGGIFSSDMARVLRARGWDTDARSTTAARVQQSLTDSVPVIALIKVAANRYHYVVIIAWTATDVTYHDPAVSPSMKLDAGTFMRRWAGANHWAAFVRPSPVVASAAVPLVTRPSAGRVDSLPCRPWLDQAADAASINQLDVAEQLLQSAATNCPSEPLVVRELAGLRFRQGKRADATLLAEQYARRAPADSLGWQLLATSRYLTGDPTGALQAWNAIGKPTVDLLRIDGTRKIRFRTLAEMMIIQPGGVLTPAQLSLAQRRISDVPALSAARVSYTAVAGGAVEVRTTVVERPVIEPLPTLIVTSLLNAAVRRDVTFGVHSPLGAGEVWTTRWRWAPANPQVALRLDIPAHIGVPAIVTLDRAWETYRFSGDTIAEQRRESAVMLTGWTRPDIEQSLGARYERWSGARTFLTMTIGGGLHRAHDRVSLLVEGERGVAISSGTSSYDRLRTRFAWRFPADAWSNSWAIRLAGDLNSRATPRGLWTVAGGDIARDVPLRAYPLILDDRLPSSRTGRKTISGGVSGDRSLAAIGPLSLGTGIFVDGANVTSTADSTIGPRFYLDAGAGLRIALKSRPSAAIRVDVARGLVTDQRWGVSVGFVPSTIPRLRRRR